MKKFRTTIVIAIVAIAGWNLLFWQSIPRQTAWAGSPYEPIIIDPNTTAVKIDDQTVEITTTKNTVTVIERDKAELQTELDHIPDRKAEIQKQLDAVNERETELITILGVFE